MKQGKNFHGLKYWSHTESVLLFLWNYVRNQYEKIFENNPHSFKCSVTFTKRDLWLSHGKSQGYKTEKTEDDCREESIYVRN